MVVRSYSEMIEGYNKPDLNLDDRDERMEMLSKYKFAVIFEGDFLELDNLQKWIHENITTSPLQYLFYGKLGYDYGFFELFFDRQEDAEKVSLTVPTLYTAFPNGKTLRTNGMDEFIYKE